MSERNRPRQWRTSSRCESAGCVEVLIEDDRVVMRQSADPDGSRLAFSHGAWAAFLETLRSGALDQ
jgi:uncharacterized protein DUF397